MGFHRSLLQVLCSFNYFISDLDPNRGSFLIKTANSTIQLEKLLTLWKIEVKFKRTLRTELWVMRKNSAMQVPHLQMKKPMHKYRICNYWLSSNIAENHLEAVVDQSFKMSWEYAADVDGQTN